jgi:hypothetical protein
MKRPTQTALAAAQLCAIQRQARAQLELEAPRLKPGHLFGGLPFDLLWADETTLSDGSVSTVPYDFQRAFKARQLKGIQ